MCDDDYDSDDLFVDSPISVSQSNSQKSNSEYDMRYQNWDNKRIRQLRDILTGVPPPPSVTTPRHTAEDVVKIWAETSLNLVDSGFSESESRQECSKISMDEALNSNWPEVKNSSYFDVYYNQGNCSEELCKLYEKYKERYIDCETSSFINYKSPKKKKDRPKITGHSPGRRLSHLAKRRTIFSSASLLAASRQLTLGPEKKTIMMNAKYEKHKGKLPKRILFRDDDFKRNSEKSTVKIYSPSKFSTNKMAIKRETPRKNTPKKSTSSYCTPKKSSSMHCTPKKSTPKKLLGISIHNENGKRMRNPSTDNSDIEAVYGLSSSQKRKLLWAVSGALKNIGIGSSHDDFQICGKRLYKRCRAMWTGNNGESTSERMLSLACENAKHVLNEVQLTKSNNVRNLIFNEDSSSCDSFFKI